MVDVYSYGVLRSGAVLQTPIMRGLLEINSGTDY